MKFYISDTHFRHKNILRFDGRPWDDTAAMENDMIALWNSKVQKSDEVYILGDFCWGLADAWREILPKLHGKKFLIQGNHDLKKIPEDVRRSFVGISGYKEIKDGDYNVILSHYPLIAYKHDADPNTIMLYGHVHNTDEFRAVKESVQTMKECCAAKGYQYRGRLYNCWCGFYGWMPATLNEILVNKFNH